MCRTLGPGDVSAAPPAMIGKHEPRVHPHQAEHDQGRRIIADPEIQQDAEDEIRGDGDDRQRIGRLEAVPPPGIRLRLVIA